jgi:RNA polymerase sigma factor (TIGR02999 family)
MADTAPEITALLRAWRRGDETALERLTPQVYRELHRAAGRCMRGEREGHTLQTTDLINELYLRLTVLQQIDWQNRAHFFAVCARQMRRILTDQARVSQGFARRCSCCCRTDTLTGSAFARFRSRQLMANVKEAEAK